jgi:hypothetical protein
MCSRGPATGRSATLRATLRGKPTDVARQRVGIFRAKAVCDVSSWPHEALVQLFRHRPACALELVRQTTRRRPRDPTHIEAKVKDLGSVPPVEVEPDLVILVGKPTHLAVIVEVQRKIDRVSRTGGPRTSPISALV